MSDALTAKSTGFNGNFGTTTRLPPVSQIPCVFCGGTAHVLEYSLPPPGHDPDTWKFRCIHRHDTYLVIKRTLPPPPSGGFE